ncbi:MAG: hypothetical protein EBU84_01750 [Actinobacteria bacterium]|nr:hypothetical protein [Actinomycetota bacterium]
MNTSGLPSLFTCEVCGMPLRPQDSTTVRMATVWLRAKGRTVHNIAEEHHRYKHEFCTALSPSDGIQDALF